MYSIKKLLTDYNDEAILKSVGIIYTGIDISYLRVLLITHMKLFNMLDDKSMNIVQDSDFWKLLTENKVNDIISIYYNISTLESNISEDVLSEIALNMTDINDITSLYNTNRFINRKLNDADYLHTLANNISNSNLKPLPKLLKISIGTNNIIDFKSFVDWYISNYYTDRCNTKNTNLTCMSGALTNNNNTKALEYLKDLHKDNDLNESWNMKYIPLSHLLFLLQNSRHIIDFNNIRRSFRGVLYEILLQIQDDYILRNKNLDSEINSLDTILGNYRSIIMTGYTSMYSSTIGCPPMFKIAYYYYGVIYLNDITHHLVLLIKHDNDIDNMNHYPSLGTIKWYYNSLESAKLLDQFNNSIEGAYQFTYELWQLCMFSSNNEPSDLDILYQIGKDNGYHRNAIIDALNNALELGSKNVEWINDKLRSI